MKMREGREWTGGEGKSPGYPKGVTMKAKIGKSQDERALTVEQRRLLQHGSLPTRFPPRPPSPRTRLPDFGCNIYIPSQRVERLHSEHSKHSKRTNPYDYLIRIIRNISQEYFSAILESMSSECCSVRATVRGNNHSTIGIHISKLFYNVDICALGL